MRESSVGNRPWLESFLWQFPPYVLSLSLPPPLPFLGAAGLLKQKYCKQNWMLTLITLYWVFFTFFSNRCWFMAITCNSHVCWTEHNGSSSLSESKCLPLVKALSRKALVLPLSIIIQVFCVPRSWLGATDTRANVHTVCSKCTWGIEG